MEGYTQMTGSDSKQPAAGGRVWSIISSDSPQDIPPSLAYKIRIILYCFLLSVASLGMGFGLFWVRFKEPTPSLFWNYAGMGFWLIASLIGLLSVWASVHDGYIKKRFTKRMGYATAFSNAAIVVAVCIACLIIQPFNNPNIPGGIEVLPPPEDSWIQQKAEKLTGVTDFKVSEIKQYEDKNHMTAIVETDDAVRLLELYYINGEWKAALQ